MKKEKWFDNTTAIIIGLAIVLSIGYTQRLCSPSSLYEVRGKDASKANLPLTTIPTIEEVQQFLADKGYYKGKIDGKLAPNWQDSKTQAAWDTYICDVCAKPYMGKALQAEPKPIGDLK